MNTNDRSWGRKKKNDIRQRRRDALKNWIKSLSGDVQLFHCQLRHAVQSVEKRAALAKALISTRVEARSSAAQSKPNQVRESYGHRLEEAQYSMYHTAANRVFKHAQAP